MYKGSIVAIILTYNEEQILRKCLEALDFVDSIIVFDSFSIDSTTDIAKSFNAEIFKREFDNYAEQRNAALNAAPNKYNWILMVDADEIVTPELKDEILSQVAVETDIDMYRVRRKDMFRNKWIKRSSGYPTWFPRLFRNGKVQVRRKVNEEYITEGKVANLSSHLLHYPFNKGMNWWFEKHRRYSQMEAELMKNELQGPNKLSQLFAKDPVIRRKAQKRLSYQIPFRPQVIFLALLILRGGFLDGRAGFAFCKLRMTYEKMIAEQFKQLQQC